MNFSQVFTGLVGWLVDFFFTLWHINLLLELARHCLISSDRRGNGVSTLCGCRGFILELASIHLKETSFGCLDGDRASCRNGGTKGICIRKQRQRKKYREI